MGLAGYVGKLSGTICVDLRDDSEDLVENARGKLMEGVGPANSPTRRCDQRPVGPRQYIATGPPRGPAMPPSRPVPEAASPDGAAAASPGGCHGESRLSRQSRHGVSPCYSPAATLGGGKSMQSRHDGRCSAFLRMDGGSEWSFENQRSGAIGVAGVAHGKSWSRLRKRLRRMKPAKGAQGGTGGQYGRRATTQPRCR